VEKFIIKTTAHVVAAEVVIEARKVGLSSGDLLSGIKQGLVPNIVEIRETGVRTVKWGNASTEVQMLSQTSNGITESSVKAVVEAGPDGSARAQVAMTYGGVSDLAAEHALYMGNVKPAGFLEYAGHIIKSRFLGGDECSEMVAGTGNGGVILTRTELAQVKKAIQMDKSRTKAFERVKENVKQRLKGVDVRGGGQDGATNATLRGMGAASMSDGQVVRQSSGWGEKLTKYFEPGTYNYGHDVREVKADLAGLSLEQKADYVSNDGAGFIEVSHGGKLKLEKIPD
jgi:hypothetical protein